MTSINVILGPPGSGKSLIIRSQLVSKWYSVCSLSTKVMEVVEEKIDEFLSFRHPQVFLVSFKKVFGKTYLLQLDALEKEMLSLLNHAVRSTLRELLGSGFPIPEKVLPPPTSQVIHEIMRISARKCLKNRIIEEDTIYAKVRLDDFDRFLEEGRKCLRETVIDILLALKASALVSTTQYYPQGFELCPLYKIEGMPLEALCDCSRKARRIESSVVRAFNHVLRGDIEIIGGVPYLRRNNESIEFGALSDHEKKFVFLVVSLSTCKGCTILMEKPDSGLHPLMKFMEGVALASLTPMPYEFWIETVSPELLLGLFASCSSNVSRSEIEYAISNAYSLMEIELRDEDLDRIRSSRLKGSCEVKTIWGSKVIPLSKALSALAPEGGFTDKLYTWMPSLRGELGEHDQDLP